MAESYASVRILLFGTLQVVCDRAQRISREPAALLLAYLALHAPAAIPRSRLAGVLAPESPEPQARRLLTDTLYHLRHELHDTHAWLHAEPDSIRLDPAHVQVDVHEFEQRCASAELLDWQHALALYSGDLLEDLDAEWLLPRRAQLREQYLSLLERVCMALVQANDLTGALTYAHRWTLADPLREEAHALLMRLYARVGRHAAALQQFEQLTRTLAVELGAEPLAQTRRLAESIRAEYEARSDRSLTPAPLIGRRRERAQLLQHVEQAQAGQGRLVLLEGEAGIGKTRLLDALAEGAAWRGLQVAWGRARELSGTPLYAPLLEALNAALSAPRVEQVRDRLAPRALAALGRVLPRLQPRPSADAQPDDLSHALAALTLALSELSPYVMICDDVQWAEDAFWDVLAQLTPSIHQHALCLVLSYRAEDVRANARAWSALQALDREQAPSRVMLAGLSAGESAELARAYQPDMHAGAARALHERTRGNPLFVRELLAQPDQPATLSTLFARRLDALAPAARDALEAAAVLGREFTHGTWHSLTPLDLIEQLPALVQSRFIAEGEHGYTFQHDLAREHVYRSIEPSRLRAWHQRAAEVLQRERAEPGILAWHFEQAEQWEQAVRAYREAGISAARASAHNAALQDFARALQLCARLQQPDAEHLSILCARQRVWGTLLRVPERQADVDEIEQLATHLNDPAALLVALEARIDLLALAANFGRMQHTAERALSLARELADPVAEARIARALGRHLVDTLAMPAEAEPYVQRAIALAETIPDHALLASALCSLSYIQRITGRCAVARDSAARALALCETHGTLEALRGDALHVLASASWSLGEWEAARETLRRSIELHRTLDHRWALEEACNSFATLASWIGQHAEARASLNMFLSRADNNRAFESEATSAYVHVLAGELDAAEALLQNLDAWIKAPQDSRAISTALIALGWLRLAQARPRDAVAPLGRAVRMWQSSPTVGVTPLLLHAIAAARADDRQAARTSLRLADEVLQPTDVMRYNVLRHFARCVAYDSDDDLDAAYQEVQRQAQRFQDERLRAAFLNQSALNREVCKRWQALHPVPPPLSVPLARVDSPLGKSLAAGDYVSVQWTVDAGESDAAILQRHGKVALRRHRLQRLLAEAHAQGAAPTDTDLAQALGVTLRTVERDMAALKAAGQPIATRRRRP